MQNTEAPVLFVTFNRPDETRAVFEAIRKAKPVKLYIFSDGPRADKYEADEKKILQNRKLIEEIDWDCQVETRFLSQNVGCGLGVSGAVSWVLEKEDRVIVLEDDCVPSQSFFSFCNILLKRYEHDERIMNISGTRWNEEYAIKDCDYFYTRYAHIWGWATWRRAWQLYDYYIADWPMFRVKKMLNIAEGRNAPMVKRWTFLFDEIYHLNNKHTWDYQWQYAIYKQNAFSLNSTKNLVTNIGLVGMHSRQKTMEHERERYEVNKHLLAPPFPYPIPGFEVYHGRKFFLRDRNDVKIWYDYATSMLSFLNK